MVLIAGVPSAVAVAALAVTGGAAATGGGGGCWTRDLRETLGELFGSGVIEFVPAGKLEKKCSVKDLSFRPKEVHCKRPPS